MPLRESETKSENDIETTNYNKKEKYRKNIVPPLYHSDVQPNAVSRRRLKDQNIVRYSVAFQNEHKGRVNKDKERIHYDDFSEDDDNDEYQSETVQMMEEIARSKAKHSKLYLFLQDGYSAFRIFETYLISIDSVLGVFLTIFATLYSYHNANNKEDWGGLSWVLLSYAVVSPISTTFGQAFFRRERAVRFVTNFRSYALSIYLAHAVNGYNGSREQDEGWLRHSDEVLTQLIGMGDDLTRFLTLPTSTLSYHHSTFKGRREAARMTEVSYLLFDLVIVKRMTKLSMLAEKIARQKHLTDAEALRIRQIDRQLGNSIESMRMIKMYRTPLALRVFARLFTVLLPPFYCNNFAQLAYNTNSLALALTFGAITSLALTTLFEAIKIMEDPFVAYTTLDGIDCREEFSVIHWHQLVNARKMAFPNAPPVPKHRVDEDGFVPDVGALEGSFKHESLLVNKNKLKEVSIRETAYAAHPMDGDDGIIENLRQKFATGIRGKSVLNLFGDRNIAENESIRQGSVTRTSEVMKKVDSKSGSIGSWFDNIAGRARANTGDATKGETEGEATFSLNIHNSTDQGEDEEEDTSVHIFGTRSRFQSFERQSRRGPTESTTSISDKKEGSDNPNDQAMSQRRIRAGTFDSYLSRQNLNRESTTIAGSTDEDDDSVKIFGNRTRFYSADTGDGQSRKGILEFSIPGNKED